MFGNDSSKNTKWGFAFITLYNRDAIEKKIKKMAARGGAGTPFTAEALKHPVCKFRYPICFTCAVPLPVGRHAFLFSRKSLLRCCREALLSR